MALTIIKEGEPLSPSILEQTEEIVQLAINIWSERHDEVAIHELFKAIMQDEPMKMRRLADIFHIDVASIHEMWIVGLAPFEGGDPPEELLKEAVRALKTYCAIAVGDLYEGRIILFSSDLPSLEEAESAMEALLRPLARYEDVTLTRCAGLQSTTEVRRAYLAETRYLPDAKKLFPSQRCFDLAEIHYARECRELIQRGEEAIAQCMRDFRRILKKNPDNARTLLSYYLDAQYSVTRTAKLLYVHKNTIKYRLKVIGDLLGYRVDKMPESQKLYQAAAVYRMLE